VARQRFQRLLFLFQEELQGRSARGVMDVGVGTIVQPPTGTTLEIIKILKLTATKQVVLHILERSFDFSFGLRPSSHTSDGFALVMGNKGCERRIEYRAAGLPPQYYCLFVIIETLLR